MWIQFLLRGTFDVSWSGGYWGDIEILIKDHAHDNLG
jgi:hypothetical protein